MNWMFVNVYDPNEEHRAKYWRFLYNSLQERLLLPDTNISHTKMPTWAEHIKFIESRPYRFWDILVNADEPSQCIGFTYVTKYRNEIGVYVAPQHRRKGYARMAVQALIDSYPEETFLANINPKNQRSQSLFIGLGFDLVQYTFKKAPSSDDASK